MFGVQPLIFVTIAAITCGILPRHNVFGLICFEDADGANCKSCYKIKIAGAKTRLFCDTDGTCIKSYRNCRKFCARFGGRPSNCQCNCCDERNFCFGNERKAVLPIDIKCVEVNSTMESEVKDGCRVCLGAIADRPDGGQDHVGHCHHKMKHCLKNCERLQSSCDKRFRCNKCRCCKEDMCNAKGSLPSNPFVPPPHFLAVPTKIPMITLEEIDVLRCKCKFLNEVLCTASPNCPDYCNIPEANYPTMQDCLRDPHYKQTKAKEVFYRQLENEHNGTYRIVYG